MTERIANPWFLYGIDAAILAGNSRLTHKYAAVNADT